ncbi:hypothetical protein F5Y16DRAFT_398023 [Xylariaceae sp. FL0255]|nr:hypothetical protein F5Y16DRAFT_398023 [Xylariaceae sp. FL0255]
MGFFATLTAIAAPAFLIASPIFSYTDQALSMRRLKSSAGFSLDIPLIMLVASIFRIFYYPGAKYDFALLIQSFINIFMMVLLLKIALDNRPGPSWKGGDAAQPFASAHDASSGWQRPYNFWQWRSSKPYWQFLVSLFITLAALELLVGSFESIYPLYSSLIGYIGLGVEATLPLPQLIANAQSKSCKGFRLSVLASWLLGDSLKMFWFFTATTDIPLAFKLCGIFQAICDASIGIQYVMYGNQSPSISQNQKWPQPGIQLSSRPSSGWSSPMGRRTPVAEKTY